jgi:hypothetical protein
MSNQTYELELGVEEVYACYDCLLWDIPNSALLWSGFLIVIIVVYIVYRNHVKRPICRFQRAQNVYF